MIITDVVFDVLTPVTVNLRILQTCDSANLYVYRHSQPVLDNENPSEFSKTLRVQKGIYNEHGECRNYKSARCVAKEHGVYISKKHTFREREHFI